MDRHPKPSPHLSSLALERFLYIEPILFAAGIVTVLDDAMLNAHCQAYARWREAEEALARIASAWPDVKGLMLKTEAGNWIQNPLVGVANTAMREMMKSAVELGMSPSARARVTALDNGQTKDDLEELLAG